MPTGAKNVCLSREIGSNGPIAKMALLTRTGHGVSAPLCHSNEKATALTSLASNVELAIRTNALLTEQALRGVLPAVEELSCFESSVCHALGSGCLLEPP
jgi:hypothetical protein